MPSSSYTCVLLSLFPLATLGAGAGVTISVSPNPAVFGAPVMITAAVEGCTVPAGARITLYDGVTVIGTASANPVAPFSTVTLPAGKRKLRAYYPGDAVCSAGSSPVVEATVAPVGSNYFRFARAYPSPGTPFAVATADFDGDGRFDLAVSHAFGIRILRGNGDGTFQVAGDYAAGISAGSLAAGDFNRDGKADIAFTGESKAGILFGNGDGTFQAPQTYAPAGGAGSLATGDFNRDGYTDLAVTGLNMVSILPGNPDGTLKTAVSQSVGSAATLQTGDFNLDGYVDLAVLTPSSNSVQILLGKGDGTFGAPVGYGTGMNPVSIAAEDLNGDGTPDLAVVNLASANVSILIGKGDGTFRSAVNYPAGTNLPNGVATGDFNGDGIADLAVTDADLDFQLVAFFSGNGDGTFQSPTLAPAGSIPAALAVGDFNRDGRADLAVVDYPSALGIILGGTVALTPGGSPQTAVVGTAFGEQLRLTIRDSDGTPVTGVAVRFAAPSSGAGASLSSEVAVTDAAGTAAVAAAANGVSGVYTVTASALGFTATYYLTNIPQAAILASGGGAQSTLTGSPFAAPLQVNCGTSGVQATFVAPATGPSAILSASNVTTDHYGFASVTAAANSLAGSYHVTASCPGTGTAAFQLTNIDGAAAAWWTFDAADISGNLAADRSGQVGPASFFNVTAETGAVNQAFRFAGAGSYAMHGDDPRLQLTHDLTLAAWIKTTNSSQTQNLISKYDFSGAESGYLLQVLATGVMNLHVGGNNLAGVPGDARDTTPINDGQWHHIVAAITLRQQVAFYVDGRLSSTQKLTINTSGSVAPIYLGTLPGAYNGQPFTGSLDEVRVYARALAGGEAASLLGWPLISSFSPDSATPGAPLTLTIHGTGFVPPSNAVEPFALFVPRIGVLKTTYVSSTELRADLPIDLTGAPITLYFQVYNGYPNGPASNIVLYELAPLTPSIASLNPPSIAAGAPAFSLTVKGSGFNPFCLCEPDPFAGVQVLWNGMALPLINQTGGTEITAQVPASYVASAGTAAVRVVNFGGIASNTLTFTISGSQPLSLTCLPPAGPGQIGVAYSSTCTASGGSMPYHFAVSPGLPAGIAVTGTTASTITIGGMPSAGGAYSYSVNVTDSSQPVQSASVPFSGTIAIQPPSGGPAGSWSFDAVDITGNQALDRSGNGLNGTIAGAVPIAGRVNEALSFSGAGSFVSVPDSAGQQLTHDLTLAAWIQTTNHTQTQNFIGKYDYTGAESGYLLQVLPSGVLNLHLGGNNLAGGGRDAPDTTPINDGQWHHVAAVIALGQNVRFYVDGRLSSAPAQMAAASYASALLYLGTSPGSYRGLPFTGALDEVRIFAGSLGAADIAGLASAAGPPPPPPPPSAPAPSAYWTFDTGDVSGNQAVDRSGNQLTALLNGTSQVEGRFGQALAFNGAGSYAVVPNAPAFQLLHDVTLTAWVKTTNQSEVQNFLGKYDFTGAESGYLLQVLPSGVVNLHLGGNNLAAGSRDAPDSTMINDGQWHHVAVVITLGQDVRFYIDGRLSSTQPQKAFASGNSAPLYLGTFPGAYSGLPYTGVLDEVRTYGQALGASDIAALAGLTM